MAFPRETRHSAARNGSAIGVNSSEASHEMAKPPELTEPGHYQRIRKKLVERKRQLQGMLTEFNAQNKKEYFDLRDRLGRRMDPAAFEQYQELKREYGRKKAPLLREEREIEEELHRIEPFFKREQRLEYNQNLTKSREEKGKVDWDSYLRTILNEVLELKAAVARIEETTKLYGQNQ